MSEHSSPPPDAETAMRMRARFATVARNTWLAGWSAETGTTRVVAGSGVVKGRARVANG